jgi:hypothetical protein
MLSQGAPVLLYEPGGTGQRSRRLARRRGGCAVVHRALAASAAAVSTVYSGAVGRSCPPRAQRAPAEPVREARTRAGLPNGYRSPRMRWSDRSATLASCRSTRGQIPCEEHRRSLPGGATSPQPRAATALRPKAVRVVRRATRPQLEAGRCASRGSRLASSGEKSRSFAGRDSRQRCSLSLG